MKSHPLIISIRVNVATIRKRLILVNMIVNNHKILIITFSKKKKRKKERERISIARHFNHYHMRN